MLNPALEVEDDCHTVSLLAALGDYAAASLAINESVIVAARMSLIAGLGRAFEALRDPECAALIGPLVPGALMPGGARVPGTSLELDPAQAAFCNGLLLCHAVSGDGGPAAEQRCAADSLGAILAIADYRARKGIMEGRLPPSVRDVLAAIAKAARIQSVLDSAADREHTGATLRVTRIASAAITAAQLGGTRQQIVAALSYACMDSGIPIDAHERYGVGHRGWATADAISRAVRHACQAIAAGQSGHVTSGRLAAIDHAGKLLLSRPHAASLLVGANALDPLSGLERPHEITQLTTRFQTAVDRYFPARQAERIKALFATPERLDDLPVNELLAALVTNGAR
jgi:2-methylcitrate dehydratase PrpD